MIKAIRQGDVLLKFVGNIPSNCRNVGHLTLAEGEVTGHSHKILDSDCAVLMEEPTSKRRFLDVKNNTTVQHEEHGVVALKPGKYEVTIQREYEPEGWRNVSD
jgi:hypothetical protein